MAYEPGSLTPQGFEGHMGANAVGAFLFMSLLVPFLRTETENSGQSSHIVWTGSVQIEMNSPPGGIEFVCLNSSKTVKQYVNYSASKCGNLFLAHESAA